MADGRWLKVKLPGGEKAKLLRQWLAAGVADFFSEE
jgi:hypothetical protein